MIRRLALATAVTAGLAACGGNTSDNAAPNGTAAPGQGPIACRVADDTRVGIATGNATGVYFALGNAYAEQLAAATDGKVRATAAETGASVQNIEQLVAGDYQVAFTLADTAADAAAGKDSFTTPQPIRALARIHTNFTQVIVRDAANIDSVEDLKGKKVSTGSPKSGTEVIAQRLLAAAGLDPESDVSAQRLDLTKTVDGMKSGTLDAMFWSGGLPTPGITDLFVTAGKKVALLDISPLLPELKKVNEVYAEGVIPANVYKTPGDVKTIVVPNLLLGREDLDADLACVLTRTLFSRRTDLEKANASAKDISLAKAREVGPIELHSGSEQALRDLEKEGVPSASPSPSATRTPS